MAGLDPRGLVNRALLVGVSEYDLVRPPHGVPGDLPAVKHSLNRLREALRRGGVFGEREITVSRSPSLDDFSRALRQTAAEAEGVLLLYFAGHGAIPSAGDELFLQMRNASVVAGGHAVFPGAEMFTTVLTVLATSEARRIVIVLDCCFAGNAAWVWETFRDKRRVLLLMSVQANHRTDAGDPGTPTPFTAELARLLEGDGKDGEGGLWFRGLADGLREAMAAGGHRTLRGEPWEPLSRAEPGEDVLLRAPGPAPADGPGPAPPERPAFPERPAPPDPPKPPLPVRLRTAAGAAVAAVRRRRRARVPAGQDRAGPPDRPRPGSRRRPAVLAGLLALALIGIGSYRIVVLTGDPVRCAPPLELRVLTDPDLEPTVRAAADAYLTSEQNTAGDGCRRSGITVYSAGTADAVTALGRRSGAWKEPGAGANPQRDVGPQPDIWIPGSPADVARVTAAQDTDAVARLDADGTPLAYSPVVLAVPQAVAAELLEERVGVPLNRMIDALRGRLPEAEVRRPDPEFTDTGLLATVGLYGTGTGSGARDAAGAERRVAQPGPPSPTAADLLCVLPDVDAVDERTAALVPEFLMKSGVGCDSRRRTARIAQYPGDVPGLEPVFTRVRWQGADRDAGARDDAAEAFRRWLAGAPGRAVFARDGFRSATDDRALLDADRAAGVLHAPSRLTRTAGRDATEAALDGYRNVGGPGRALFLLDSSGSMAGRWEGSGGGPGLLKQSLGGLGGRDEYALWTVSGTGDDPYDTLLPFGRHARRDAERTVDRAAVVRDAEADPHGALLAALDAMRLRGADDERPDLVVYITDDEDAGRLTGDRLADVIGAARAAGVPVTMVSLTGGSCDAGEPDARISEATGGRCLDTGDDLGGALHDEVARTGTGED
ncbi:substrate-binding domain-containing protein [Streptomyces sp. NPDC000134]|uniref:vWA domain-containing protein n=1 Tax=Streptomyces sp. NPDC000134 TaxID=3364536 RepID=UPI0036B30E3D